MRRGAAGWDGRREMRRGGVGWGEVGCDQMRWGCD